MGEDKADVVGKEPLVKWTSGGALIGATGGMGCDGGLLLLASGR